MGRISIIKFNDTIYATKNDLYVMFESKDTIADIELKLNNLKKVTQ